MEFYDIEEPEEERQGIAVGIDLGTTNSLIAFKRGEKIEVISDPKTGSNLLPSIVWHDGKNFIVGEQAKVREKNVSSIKRLMGKTQADLKDSNHPVCFRFSNKNIPIVKVGEFEITPIEISAEILKKLKIIAEDQLKEKIIQAVITVPAYFDHAARSATRHAAELAGIEVLRLVNEPTSAAIAHHLNFKLSGIFLVYDLGGGTFDVSVLKMHNGVLQVIAIAGDSMLGGDDFDHLFLKYICQHHNIDISQIDTNKALSEIRSLKEFLSFSQEWSGSIKSLDLKCVLLREDLEKAVEELTLKTMKLVKKALRDASLSTDNIDEIILVGGATKMPMISEKLKEYFNKEPLKNIDPEEVVVMGAAIQANTLTSGSNNLLLDVNPISLGIELLGGIVEHIIPKNAPVPTLINKTYTTYQDNQTGIKFHILQGEGEKVSQCKSLGMVELSGLPKLPAGKIDIDISFRIDADGILTVIAEETKDKKAVEISINTSM